ncbi:phosphatidylcholine transfer protein isoform X1 [Ahaetulla prasina]|uniref:phosphatidylcholine transfer protein isoform X1 n=2 Tax=Ahaetulla prasina TaxID=499056 RepID=UPI002648D129|nr:phosphatidylcholine transfer protein isoform X1 [Ahaetulla prasina]
MCPPEIFSNLVRRLPGGLLKGAAKEELEEGERCACPFSVGMSRSSVSNVASSSAAHVRRPEHSRPAFSEDQFLAVSKELVSPSARPDTWQLLTNVQGLCIYRLYDEKSGLYEYKIYSKLTDCSPELCADVYMDLNYRTKWDQYVKNVREKTQDGKTAIYWEVKFPFPLANRDYVFVRERQDMELDGQKIYVILAKSVNTVKFSEKPGIVRVKNFRQGVAFASDGKKGCKVFMTYFDDPGGKLPSWVVNWAAKTGVPNFLKDMQKACQSYRKR